MNNLHIKEKLSGKKGFTLVELVVVIAILAVLAAIAIPAVITIVNNASDTSLETEAASIDLCCKTYYEEIKLGVITANTYTPKNTSDRLPAKSDSINARTRAARKCTVAGALDYNGMYADFAGRLDEFAYDSGGNIIAVTGDLPTGYTKIKADGSTTFAELNYAN